MIETPARKALKKRQGKTVTIKIGVDDNQDNPDELGQIVSQMQHGGPDLTDEDILNEKQNMLDSKTLPDPNDTDPDGKEQNDLAPGQPSMPDDGNDPEQMMADHLSGGMTDGEAQTVSNRPMSLKERIKLAAHKRKMVKK